MSLIVDMLKKINKEKTASSKIPPSLMENKDKEKTFLPYLIVLFLVVTAAAGGFIYYISSIEQENVISTHIPKKEIKIAKKTIEQKESENVQISQKIENNLKDPKKEKKYTQETTQNKGQKNQEVKKIEKVEKKPEPPASPPVKPAVQNLKAPPPPKIFTQQEYTNLLNLANVYLNQGNYRDAIKIYEKILKFKNDDDILNNLLVLYVKTGQENKIYKFLPKISEKILINITIELLNFQKIENTMEILDKTKKSGINSYLAYAIFYEKIGDINTAYDYYKKAYHLEPDNPIKAYYYARVLEIKGKYKNALKIYKSIYPKLDNNDLKNIVKNRIDLLSIIEDQQ